MDFVFHLFSNGVHLLWIRYVAEEILALELSRLWKERCKRLWFPLSAFFLMVSALECVFPGDALRILISLFCTWGILGLCFEKISANTWLYIVIINLFIILLDAIGLNFADSLFVRFSLNNSITGLHPLVGISASFFTFIFIKAVNGAIKRNFAKTTRSLDTPQLILMSLFLCVGIFIEFLLWAICDLAPFGNGGIAILILNVVITLVIVFQIYLMMPLIISRNFYREKAELMEHHLEEQKQYYSYMEKRERETRKLRHDMSAHLSMLMHFNSIQDTASVEDYLTEMTGRLNRVGKSVHLNNGIVEAIAGRYIAECESEGIALLVKGSFPCDLYMSDYDLVTIFSNLLSNAVEATKACKGKEISLEVRHERSDIFVYIQNDCGAVTINQGKIATTKPDRQMHGFGLENVKDAIRRNGGWISMEVREGKFHTYIQLRPVKKENGEKNHEGSLWK